MPHVKKEINQVTQPKTIYMGLFTTIYRNPPRLGQSAEPAQGCTASKPARKCSILTFQLVL